MPPFLDPYHEQISALCRRYGVRRLEVFGSAVDPARFDHRSSDIDLLVEFDPAPEGARAEQYFGLLEELTALLGRPVDLVVERAIRNPYFRQSVQASRQPIYLAAPAP